MKPQVTRPDALAIRRAAVLVWVILSGCGAMAVLASRVLPCDLLLRASSYSQVSHQDCALCGMTRAVVLISSGDLRQAASLNRGAVPFYILALANSFLALWYVGSAFLKGKACRHRPARTTSLVVVKTGKGQPWES